MSSGEESAGDGQGLVVMAEHGIGVVELVVISERAELHVEGGRETRAMRGREMRGIAFANVIMVSKSSFEFA